MPPPPPPSSSSSLLRTFVYTMEHADFPSIFRCPISLKIMDNPVTISTGITYDRRSIEKWLFTYKKSTCPATMQPLHNLDLIPNHTLKNLILSFLPQPNPSLNISPNSLPISSKHRELTSILSAMGLLSATKLGSSSLDVLLECTAKSKANRLRAVEAGAVRVLIEALPDEGGRRRGEKRLMVLKRLCACAEGRAAFVEHGMGVAAVASKMGREVDLATKLAVKVLWLVCRFWPRKEVVEGMMDCGAVGKLFGLIRGDGRSSTKEKAVGLVRMFGDVWRRNPCFPVELMGVKY